MNRLPRLALALLVASQLFACLVSAQVISPFGDLGGTSCTLTAPPLVPTPFYLLAIPGPLGTMIGAEFRVTGLPSGLYLHSSNRNPLANVAVGDPMEAGCDIAFPVCQSGANPILLYTVFLINLGDPVGDHTLRVERHTTPFFPPFACPLMILCDEPVFTKVCVNGGEGYLNSPRNCEVAVDHASWSKVKSMYD